MLIVATATDKEMNATLGFAGAPAVKQGEDREFELNGHRLLLTVTGVGLVNAALTAGRLLARPDIAGVLSFGIAGAYNVGDFPLGSTCFAWQEIWPEYGLLDEDGGVDAKAIGFPQGHVDGEPIWSKLQLNPVNDAEKLGLPLAEGWARASSISLSSVTGTPERAGWLEARYTGDIENMEGFSLALAARQKGIPFLEFRTISNLVGSRSAEDWDVKAALKALGECARFLFPGK